MVRTITIYGDPVLRQKCERIGSVTDEIRQLATDMIETMHDAEGVGLAAPQVDVSLQIAVVDVGLDDESVSLIELDGKPVGPDAVSPLVFLNPELTLDGQQELVVEGCLSIPDVRAPVRRPAIVHLKYTGLDEKPHTLTADGLLARAIQHEIDHLNGVLFLDRLSTAGKMSAKRQLKRAMAHW